MPSNEARFAQERSSWLSGGGEMAKAILDTDWERTPLGPLAKWPTSLRTTVSLCLASNFPISIAWGPSSVQIYNDGYRPICGAKHPSAMGQSFRECWSSAWPVIGEAFESALRGEARFLENQRMFLDRNGFLEEAFFTFSFSPIRDEAGHVGGLFHPVTETTGRMLGERRVEALRELALCAAEAKTVGDACAHLVATLDRQQLDLPFSLLYLAEGHADELLLSGATGFATHPVVPLRLSLAGADETIRTIFKVLETGQSEDLGDFAARFALPPCGPYEESARRALAIPIILPGRDRPIGVFCAGVSARLPVDAAYRRHLELVARHVAAAIAVAKSAEIETRYTESLAQADRLKTAFLSNVSHEFRTPLTLILGPIEDLLAQAELTSVVRDGLLLAHRNGLRLTRLVDTLLNFSLVQAGRAQARYRRTDVGTLTAGLASSFRAAMERAGLSFRIACAETEAEVFVDRGMWEQIVLNLVSNAFKFTFTGQVTVACVEDAKGFRLVVSDTGIGIPEAELPHLFERFHRAERSRGRSYEGSGIGLALVRELVTLQGGAVTVASREQGGTTVTVAMPTGCDHLPASSIDDSPERASGTSTNAASAFVEQALSWLPARKDGEQTMTIARYVESRSGARRERILLADDNADMRGYITALLSEHWTVEGVCHGGEALASALANPPDLILTDVMMPVMDGFELVQHLQRHAATARIPILVLSARAEPSARIEGLRDGADDYITKPFSALELVTRVRRHLERGRARREATTQWEKLSAMLMQAPIGIATMDGPRHVFTFVNQRYNTLVLERGAIVGRTFREIFPEIEGQKFLEILDHVYRTGGPYIGHEVRIEVRRASGAWETKYVDFTCQPRRDDQGGIEGVFCITRDVTEQFLSRQKLAENERQLQDAKAAADAANAAKSTFLANVSHEIRTPLGAILGFAELLASESLDPIERTQFVESITRNGRNLARLIDDILDLSKVEAGRLDIERMIVHLPRLLEDVTSSLSLVARDKGVRLLVESIGVVPELVITDPTRLRQILTNLVGNALKFTAVGQVHVSVEYGGSSTVSEGELCFTVADTGCGLSPAAAARLFAPFAQADASTARKYGGTGLGLVVAKKIARLLGGDVTLSKTQSGVGSTFVASIRAASADAVGFGGVAPAGRADARQMLSGLRILVAEDAADNRFLIERMLKNRGAAVITATDGSEAVARVRAEAPFDAVLMDLQMPNVDGYEASKILRSEGYRGPIIALSAHAMLDERHKSIAAGCDEHLVKPVSSQHLIETLCRFALAGRRPQATAAPRSSPGGLM